MPVWLSIVLPFVTLVAGAWLQEFRKRPKLVLSGSGGGSVGTTYRSWQVSIQNRPGLLGLSLGETTVLGKNIHRGRTWGLRYDRNASVESRAWLCDEERKEGVDLLHWDMAPADPRYQQFVTIPSGKEARLMLLRLSGTSSSCSDPILWKIRRTPAFPVKQ
jgi:hypothetical protein